MTTLAMIAIRTESGQCNTGIIVILVALIIPMTVITWTYLSMTKMFCINPCSSGSVSIQTMMGGIPMGTVGLNVLDTNLTVDMDPWMCTSMFIISVRYNSSSTKKKKRRIKVGVMKHAAAQDAMTSLRALIQPARDIDR